MSYDIEHVYKFFFRYSIKDRIIGVILRPVIETM